MVCVDYNAVKEGIMFNATISGALILSDGQLKSLYDGSYLTPALTVSGTGDTVGLLQSFGESYDFCFLRYYTDEPLVNNLYGNYSTFSGTEIDLNWYLESSGVYRADINAPARNLYLTHTIASGVNTNIYQLYAAVEENSTLGFGTGPLNPTSYLRAQHATNKGMSSSANVVTLFNDNNFDDVALVAIAPTFTEEDNYIFISTTASGEYYGINGYGVGLPGHKKSNLKPDLMSSGTLSDQWYLRTPGPTHLVTRNAEGITFELGDSRYIGGVNTRKASGLLSAESFTVQSFTAEIKIKLNSYTSYTDVGSAIGNRNLMFILTNGFTIPDVGYKASQTTRERVGDVAAGIVLCDDSRDGSKFFNKDTVTYNVRLADGSALDHRYGNTDGDFISLSVGLAPSNETSQVSGPTVGDMEDINYRANDFGDYTSSSNWRTWRISYDHVKRELTGYIDNILIGSKIIREGNLSDGTRLFIGQQGDSNLSWSVKDFNIVYDSLYEQENSSVGSTVSATISGSEAYKVVDGDITTPYVAPSPNANTKIRITFESPKDVAYYTIKQRDQSTPTSIYGSVYYPDIARTAYVDFGGRFTEIHNYPNSGSVIIRSPTYSGTAVVASGINYIDFNFVLYDETVQENNALVVEQIEVFSEGYTPQKVVPVEDDNLVPWTNGIFHNIKLYGSKSSLSIRDKGKRLTSEYLPEYQIENVNYGFSSARIAEESQSNYVDSYHNGGEIFNPTYHSDSGDFQEAGQHAWKSAPQTDNHIFLWTTFEELSSVSAVYWNSFLFSYPTVADKFKFQYLVDGGSPLVEADWADFKPISNTHPYDYIDSDVDGAYKEYKDYLIANNDGEYYTGYYDMVNCTSGLGFTIGNASLGNPPPIGLPIPDSYMELQDPRVFMIRYGTAQKTNGSNGFVHFDSPVPTRGFRMVVHTSKETYTEAIAQQFTLEDIFIFRANSAGSFTSPVFDTGTAQNTERVNINADVRSNTQVKTFVRSSKVPPSYQHSSRYEFWEATGTPGNSQIEVVPSNTIEYIGAREAISAQVVGDTVYMFLTRPVAYSPLNDTWRVIAGDYPGPGSSSANEISSELVEADETALTTQYAMDTSVRPNSALVGDNIFVAAKTVGNNSVSRFMIYQIASDSWRLISGNRPSFAEQCSMVASSSGDDIFFFKQDGTISRYNISTSTWILEEASVPRNGDMGCTVEFEGKIYIFGGEDGSSAAGYLTGSNVCWYFDTASLTMHSISESPYNIYQGNAILVPEHRCIYILPFRNAQSSYDAPMKYFPDEDRWQVVESLLSFREVGDDPGGTAPNALYYKYGDSIFGLGDTPARKTLVVQEDWEPSKMPSFKDDIWGDISGLEIPWKPVGTFGEFMPQERYMQVKVELYSDDFLNSPVLNSVRVVQPQPVAITASGNADIYIKIGAIADKTYRMWYSSYDYYGTSYPLSCLYTSYSDSIGWPFPTTVSGAWNSAAFGQPPEYNTVCSMWAIESGDGYQHWFSKQEAVTSLGIEEGFTIQYSPVSSPDYISGDITIVSGTEISYSQLGATHPSVVKESPSSYKMWYTGIDSSYVKRILYCTSADSVTWVAHQLSLDTGTETYGLDVDHAYRPSVIKEGPLYRMWYTGVASNSTGSILYTESLDGLTWQTPTTAVLPGDAGKDTLQGVSDAVVAYDGTQYVMMYIGTDGTYTYLVRATSPDGSAWADHTITVPSGGLTEEVDSAGIRSVFFLVDTIDTQPSTTFTSASIKVHNEGASL